MEVVPPSFDRFLQRSYRQAALGMACFSLLLVVIQLVMIDRFLETTVNGSREIFYLLPVATFLFGLVEFGCFRGGWPFMNEKGIAILVIGEALLPTFGLLVFGFSLGWETALGSPPLLGYFLILMLGLFRLSPRWLVLAGSVEVLSFLLLLFGLWQTDRFPGNHAALQVGKAPLILVATVVGALVAGRTRHFVLGMIQHHAGELQREREIFQKDRLISILAHDLRTPVNGISGLAEFMQRYPEATGPEELRRYSREIHQSALQLRALIDNLLEWARLRTGQLVPDFQVMPVREVIDPVRRISEPALRARAMDLHIEGALESQVETDLLLAQTILRNLLSNAIKFSPNAGIVTLRIIAGSSTVLEMEDCGPGLPPAVTDALERGGVIPVEGRGGLGLMLCRELAQRLGITLQFRRSDHGGTLIRIDFPKRASTVDEPLITQEV